jgi:hypothetical protein
VSLRLAVFCSAFSLAGCGTRSGFANEVSDAQNDVESDALVCQPFVHGGYYSTYPCPKYGSIECTVVGQYAHATACTTLEGYVLGFRGDPVTVCFYDPTTHVLVGVLNENGDLICFGTIDLQCSESPSNLCSGGDADASIEGG